MFWQGTQNRGDRDDRKMDESCDNLCGDNVERYGAVNKRRDKAKWEKILGHRGEGMESCAGLLLYSSLCVYNESLTEPE